MPSEKLLLVKYPSDVTIRWLTYGTDSAGLLDFEHKNFTRHYVTLRKALYRPELFLIGDGPNCRVLPTKQKAINFLSANPRANVLATVVCEDGKLFISSPDPSVFTTSQDVLRLMSEKACKKIFGHFKSTNLLPIALNEGDEIRLGRVKLIVRHLAYNSSLPLSYLHELIAESGDSEQSNPTPTVNYTTPSQTENNQTETQQTTNTNDTNVTNDTNENESNVNNNTNTSSVSNNTTATNTTRDRDENTEEKKNTNKQNKETKEEKEKENNSHSGSLNKSELDSALSSLSKELKGKVKKRKDDDAATVSDLSTSRTNITPEQIINMAEDVENTCRICLCNDDSSGPLITPCKCKGSLTYVHLSCIRSWIKGRLNCCVEGMPNKSYFWQKLTCELCGTLYPNKININNKELDFVDIDQPQPPYLVLEPENMNDKGYFIVSLSNNHAIIGRGHDSDIRLTDISVSRTHSVLYFDHGHFIVQDRRSKFGTLISRNKDVGFKIQITPKNPILLKIGNGILCITTKRPFQPFCCSSYSSLTATYSL